MPKRVGDHGTLFGRIAITKEGVYGASFSRFQDYLSIGIFAPTETDVQWIP